MFALSGCGTDTGNPSAATDNSNQDGQPRLFSAQVASNTCIKLSRCHLNLSTAECMSSIFTIKKLTPAFGLKTSDYRYLSDVVNAEDMGELRVNAEDSQACLINLEALSCDDKKVQDSYQSESNSPFKKLPGIYSESCKSSFIKNP